MVVIGAAAPRVNRGADPIAQDPESLAVLQVVGVSHAQLVGLSVDGVAKVKMADGTLRSDLQLADKTALLQDRMRALIDSEGYVAVRITSVCMCKAIVAC